MEEFLNRKESMTVEIAQLREENLRIKRNLVGLNRVLSARRHMEAEDYMSNFNDTIRELSAEVDASTCREMLYAML